MSVIPFQIYDSHGHKIRGVTFLEDEFIVFDVQVRRFGLINQAPEKVKAELGLIADIRFESGLFGDRIIVIPRKMELLDAVPGDHKGEIKLKIARRYRDDAEAFVQEVRRQKQRR